MDSLINIFRENLTSDFHSDPKFWEAVEDFINHREEMKIPLTKMGAKRLANKFNGYDPFRCIKAMDTSIVCRWRGVFPESEVEYTDPIANKNDNPMSVLRKLRAEYGIDKMPGYSGNQSNSLSIFYKNTVLPACRVVNDDDPLIAGHIFTLYCNLQFDTVRKDTAFSVRFIIHKYLEWIRSNEWINGNAESIFEIDGKLFNRFVREHSIKYNARKNIVTGEYIKNGG